MQIQVTRARLVLAALVALLAAAGLIALITPVVGNAVASGDGKAVAGTKARAASLVEWLPRKPFHTVNDLQLSGGCQSLSQGCEYRLSGSPEVGPAHPETRATVAITQVSLAAFGSSLQVVRLLQRLCSGSSLGQARVLGTYVLHPPETVEQSLPTPIVVEPIRPGQPYCLTARIEGDAGVVELNVTGWAISGTYQPHPIFGPARTAFPLLRHH